MFHRPQVLLVVDKFDWIMGTIAKEIVKNIPGFDFYFYSTPLIKADPGQFVQLAQRMDIIHWTLEVLAYYRRLLPDSCRARHVVGMHHFLDYGWVAPYCEQADAIVTASKQWETALIRQGTPPDKITRVRYGVDTERFRPLEPRTREPHRPSLDGNASIRLGFVAAERSNDSGRKGPDVLFEALRLCREEYHLEITLLLAGEGWGWLRKQLAQVGIQTRRVHTAAAAADSLIELYNAMDALLVPSRVEGGPVPVLESLACGTPVVSTPVGIAPEVIEDGVNGFIVPLEDARALADAIKRLATDRKLLESLSKNARASVLSGWQWKHTLLPLVDVYVSLLPSRETNDVNSELADPHLQRRKVLQEDRWIQLKYLVQKGEFSTAWSWTINHDKTDLLRELGWIDFLRQCTKYLWLPSVIELAKRWLYRGPVRPIFRWLRRLVRNDAEGVRVEM